MCAYEFGGFAFQGFSCQDLREYLPRNLHMCSMESISVELEIPKIHKYTNS